MYTNNYTNVVLKIWYILAANERFDSRFESSSVLMYISN